MSPVTNSSDVCTAPPRDRGRRLWLAGRRSLGVMTASDAEGGPEAFYPGFEEDARTWGLQTSAGVCRVPRVLALCPPSHGGIAKLLQ